VTPVTSFERLLDDTAHTRNFVSKELFEMTHPLQILAELFGASRQQPRR